MQTSKPEYNIQNKKQGMIIPNALFLKHTFKIDAMLHYTMVHLEVYHINNLIT